MPNSLMVWKACCRWGNSPDSPESRNAVRKCVAGEGNNTQI